MASDGPGTDRWDGLGQASATAVVEELGRVLASPAFARSERSRALLSYVVSESLAGRGDRISERTVGRAALGRGPDFDGLGDASVRVIATRVRQALERHYAGDGAGDRLTISLPVGGYVPAFGVAGVTGHPDTLATGVAVLTPESDGDEGAHGLAVSVAHALVGRLSGFDGVTVVGPTSAMGDLAETGRRLGVSHVLAGRVAMRQGKVRLSSHLVSTHDGEVAWVRTRDEPLDGRDVDDLEDRWAVEVAAQVADHGGVVLGDVVRRGNVVGTDLELGARIAYYTYVDRSTKQSIEDAAAALDAALAAGTSSSALFAMRGAVANAAVLQGIGDPGTDTDLAEGMARKALSLDSGNAHAYLVLGGAARARRRWEQCRGYAAEAERLAPFQPASLLSAGLLLESSGEWAAGMELVERAFRLNPRLPIHAHLWLALGNVVLGRYDRALGSATLIDVDGEIFGPLYRALALAGLGDLEDARDEVARLDSLDPAFRDDVAGRFTAQLNLTGEQVARIVDLLERARWG